MKYYLVFYADEGNREDCSVYYSWLTQASSEADAIQKVCAAVTTLDPVRLEAQEMQLIP